ncbi:hypothetical protein KSX_59290 [Ktedonospora formicarum]|uniref:Uncharacterized protein n=1 Tax=Ktedonospora formicarum TaxID=2778364 RepID=A0A8J3I2V6_9CHLR|nr:hypothetical protein KSX_59290 [Ktedonospora formicarum]
MHCKGSVDQYAVSPLGTLVAKTQTYAGYIPGSVLSKSGNKEVIPGLFSTLFEKKDSQRHREGEIATPLLDGFGLIALCKSVISPHQSSP